MKTVYVTAGETTLIEWKNIPITAQIQIVKKSADYNSTNGLPENAAESLVGDGDGGGFSVLDGEVGGGGVQLESLSGFGEYGS